MAPAAEATALLEPEVRSGLRDLLIALADSKRLLGMRYAGWILGAPELEAGIACASMAQDEWGHARLLYALLGDFGDDVAAIEQGREPAAYASMDLLDSAPTTWPRVVALNAVADAALTVQIEALRACCYEPVRQRCAKLLEEERFHAAHAAAWVRRLAAAPRGRVALRDALAAAIPGALRWFGPPDGPDEVLTRAGAVDGHGDALGDRLRARLAPLLDDVGAGEILRDPPDFTGFDPRRRRAGPGGPDAGTIARVRGDRNRIFLR